MYEILYQRNVLKFSSLEMTAGRALFSDVVFKRVGEHEMRNELERVRQQVCPSQRKGSLLTTYWSEST